MVDKITNIFLAGVGGQGIILASDIMADVFLDAGYDVKKSEVHGMAQRGGSVTSHVRFGEKVASPIIPEDKSLRNRVAKVLSVFDALTMPGYCMICRLHLQDRE